MKISVITVNILYNIILYNKMIFYITKWYGKWIFLIAAHMSDIPRSFLDPSYCARFNPTFGPVSRVYSVMSTEEFSRKSLQLSRSGIEIWKFLTSYIRDLVGRSFSSLAVSIPPPLGRRSDRVATGFSISACALTLTDAFTRTHPTRCTP